MHRHIHTHKGEWHKRHNEESKELFQRSNIANEIKKRKLVRCYKC